MKVLKVRIKINFKLLKCKKVSKKEGKKKVSKKDKSKKEEKKR